jgi:hypothetical protein
MMAQAHVAGAYNMPGMGGPPSPDWRAGGGGGAGGGGYGAAPPHDYRPPPHGGGDGYGGHGGAPPPPRYDGGGGGGGGGGGYHHAGTTSRQRCMHACMPSFWRNADGLVSDRLLRSAKRTILARRSTPHASVVA